MEMRHPDRKIVTLTLQDSHGAPWSLRLSADCLCFVGRYRRIEGFHIDAVLFLNGLRRAG